MESRWRRFRAGGPPPSPVADQSIVSRVVNVLVIRGAQGIYRANAAGTTTLSATGDPPCRMATPPCGAASLLFHVTLIVQQ